MYLDKYTNAKQLCTSKVQEFREKKQSSQDKISGAIINHSVTGPLWPQELVICHLENKGGQWEVPHCPSQWGHFLPLLRQNFTHIITNFRNNKLLDQKDHLPPCDTMYPKDTWCSLTPIGEANGSPLLYSSLENSVDRGAWWAAVCGVAQSQIRLKRLSSSSNTYYTTVISTSQATRSAAENGSGGIQHKTLRLILCTSPTESTHDLKSHQPTSATQKGPS